MSNLSQLPHLYPYLFLRRRGSTGGIATPHYWNAERLLAEVKPGVNKARRCLAEQQCFALATRESCCPSFEQRWGRSRRGCRRVSTAAQLGSLPPCLWPWGWLELSSVSAGQGTAFRKRRELCSNKHPRVWRCTHTSHHSKCWVETSLPKADQAEYGDYPRKRLDPSHSKEQVSPLCCSKSFYG